MRKDLSLTKTTAVSKKKTVFENFLNIMLAKLFRQFIEKKVQLKKLYIFSFDLKKLVEKWTCKYKCKSV